MKYDPNKHHRRSIRLWGYDYSQSGAYFITLCTHERRCLFGEIINGQMRLNELGLIVHDEWFHSAKIRGEIELLNDEFVIMPNHIHGIVRILDNNVWATGRSPLQQPRGPLKKSISSFVAGFKSATTKRINKYQNTPGNPVWQRNYYEHVIRNEKELHDIRAYIFNNPENWETDENYKI